VGAAPHKGKPAAVSVEPGPDIRWTLRRGWLDVWVCASEYRRDARPDVEGFRSRRCILV